MTSPALADNLLGDPAERTMYILLPPNYETSEKRYPVVYVMPGGNGLPTHFTMGFTYATQALLRNDKIKEMILVFPDGTSRLGGGLFVSSPAIGDYETYFIRDVIDFVDTHYRTLPTRDSRGLSGCSRGGGASMRFGLKYPDLFSVVAAAGGEWDNSPEVWPTDVERMKRMKEMPREISDLDDVTNWWVQMAAAAAPDLDNPPFYAEMPFRIVDGHGEFVPEVVAKIIELDSAQEARRYLQQPVRLRGIRIQHGKYDATNAPSIQRFKQLLDELGIEHEYAEVSSGHCGGDWEAASLKYLSERLVFEE